MPSSFSIEKPQNPFRNGDVAAATLVLTLTDALRIATENSREYQSRMENVYLQALSLTLVRHRYDPIYFGRGSFEIDNDSFRKSVSSFFSFGFNKILATGADLSADMSTSLFRVVSGGDPSELATSAINLSLTQPLMRGFGREVTYENLTQGERDMIYTIRDFVRYRKTFTIGITDSYLGLLGQSDQVVNAENNLASLENQREIVSNRVLAGLSSPIEADQATQKALEARDSWIRSIASYERSLDLYKLAMGIPVESLIRPNPKALEIISQRGVTDLAVEVDKAVIFARANRLDLRNAREAVDDAIRKIPIAADLLKPGMDLVLDYTADSDGSKQVFDFADGEKNYSAGVDLDLPLDRKSERNIYREAFINLAQARRDYEETYDRVGYEVRNAVRNMTLSVQRYQIQVNSLDLARVRVERDSLLLQAGRAITRDVLESQAALLSAQNAVTSALIDYYNARLDLLLSMETLRVDDNGMIIEGTENDWEYADKE